MVKYMTVIIQSTFESRVVKAISTIEIVDGWYELYDPVKDVKDCYDSRVWHISEIIIENV